MRSASFSWFLALSSSVLACAESPATNGLPAGTTNYSVDQVVNSSVNESDFVFVVSNAPSMRDKLPQLARQVRREMEGLLLPDCIEWVDGQERVTGQALPGGKCAEGTPASVALEHVRVAVLSGSLGDHEVGPCAADDPSRDFHDHARLIASVRSDAPDPDGRAFLTYYDEERSDADAFLDAIEAQVLAVGSRGCPIQQPLEAVYRFLSDPRPPLGVVRDEQGRTDFLRDEDGAIVVDELVLEQRAAFLRPESLLVITVLADDDDCSVVSGEAEIPGSRWGAHLFAPELTFPRPAEVCAQNPNDPCCFSCWEQDSAPEHCDRSHCSAPRPMEGDVPGLRCWDAKRRFGLDLLYPTQRYVDMLTKPHLTDARTAEEFPNPLLVGERGDGTSGIRRDPGLVHFGGFVGVPWQNLFTTETLDPLAGGQYLSALELREPVDDASGQSYSRWDVILGEPGLAWDDPRCDEDSHWGPDPACGVAPTPPLDPFMVQSVLPRPGGAVHPLTGAPILPPGEPDTINGHDSTGQGSSARRLQPACAVPLEDPLPACDATELGCLCHDAEVSRAPECTPRGGAEGAFTGEQVWATARPTPRLLRTMRDVGSNARVGSVCDAAASQPRARLFEALVDRLSCCSQHHSPLCLSSMPQDERGQVDCLLATAVPSPSYPGDERYLPFEGCAARDLEEPNGAQRAFVDARLEDTGRCGGGSGRSCEDIGVCMVPQLAGVEQQLCRTSLQDPEELPTGFCYFDEPPTAIDEDGRQSALPGTGDCWRGGGSQLRLTGAATDLDDTVLFVACQQTEVWSSPEP